MTALRPGRFPDTITRRRRAAGDYNIYGEYIEGSVVETELAASVQPLSLEDAELEGGTQLQHQVKVFVPEPDALAAAFDDREADKVAYGGDIFTVIESRSWPGGHTRATLLREG